MMATGQMYPKQAQQVALLQSMSTGAGSAAGQLAKLRQESNLFARVFSGNSRENLAAILSNKAAWTQVSTQLRSDLTKVQAVVGTTEASFRNLTGVERWRVFGHVMAQEVNRGFNSIITLGKQMQWVGRQMIVGMTIPIVTGAAKAIRSFLMLNKAQTELAKYLQQTGLELSRVAAIIEDDFGPAFEKIAIDTGLYVDEVNRLGAAWVATGAAIEDITGLTDLTAQLALIGQGEIGVTDAMELVRSTMSTFRLTLEETTNELQKLSLVGGETALTLNEITTALPLTSTAAELLGLTASETATALAAMREQGVQANAAANTLKFSINRLVNPTKVATEAFKEMTGQALQPLIFDESGTGLGVDALYNLAEAFGYTADAAKQLTEQEQASLAGYLFGGYRADKMLKLLKAVAEEGGTYQRVLADIADQEKALAVWTDQLAVVQESSAFQWQQMKVQLALIAAQIGAEIVPYVIQLGNVLIDLLNKFNQSSEATKKFVLGLVGVLAALGPVTYVAAQAALAFGSLGKALIGLPLQWIFALKSAEAPMQTLLKLAKANPKNTVLQAVAGMPIATEAMATNMKEFSEVTKTSMAAVSAAQMNQIGQEEIQVALQQKQNLLLEREALIRASIYKQSYLQNQMLAMDTWASRQGLAFTQTGILRQPGGQFLSNEMKAGLGTQLDAMESLRKRYLAELAELAGIETAGVGAMTANAVTRDIDDKIRAAEYALATAIKNQGPASKAATEAGDNLAALLAGSFAGGVGGKVDTGLTAQGPTLTQKVVTWFKTWGRTTQAELQVVAQGTQSPFSLYNLIFGHPLRSLAVVGGALGAARFLPDIMKGWAEEQDEAGEILGDAFQEMVKGLQKLFGQSGKIDSVSDAFESLGNMLGKLLLSLSKLTAGVIKGVAPAFATLSEVVGRTVGVFANLVQLDIAGFFKSLFGPMNQALSLFGMIKTALVALSVTIATVFVVGRIQAFIGTFVALRAAFQGLFTSIGYGMPLLSTAAASIGRVGLAAKASQGALMGLGGWIGVVIGGALILSQVISAAFKQGTDFSEVLMDNLDGVTSALQDMGEAAAKSIDEFKAAVVSLTSATQELGKVMGGKFWEEGVGAIETFEDRALNLADFLPTIENAVKGISEISASSLTGEIIPVEDLMAIKELFSDVNTGADLVKAIDLVNIKFDDLKLNLTDSQEILYNLYNVYKDSFNGMNMSAEQYKATEQSVRDRLKATEQQMAMLAAAGQENSEAYIKQAYAAQLLRIQLMALLGVTQTTLGIEGLQLTLISPETVNKGLRELQKFIDRAGNYGGDAGKEFKEEFQNQISDLADTASDAVLDAFDNATQSRVEAMEDSADAQVEAIQKQIDAIEEQNEAEEWLAQQREWRRRREELEQKKVLDSAIAYRERMIAVAEGRYDEARLIQLKAQESARQTNEQLRDLDREEREAREDRREQEKIEKLQEQQEAIKDAASAQIEAYEEMREKLRESLEGQLELMSQFVPKNKRQWKAWQKQLEEVMEDFGVSLDEVNEIMIPRFDATLQDGLTKAEENAGRIVAWGAGNLAAIASANYASAESSAYGPEEIKLYQVMADFLTAMQEGSMKPAELASWLIKIQEAMSAASEKAQARVQGYIPNISWKAIANQANEPVYHSGGMVGGQGEVPARLLAGEYVMSRQAVNKLGPSFMESLNKYHEGGLAAANALIPYGPLAAGMLGLGMSQKRVQKLMVNKIGRGIYQAIMDQYGGQTTVGGQYYAPGTPGQGNKVNSPWGFITAPLANFVSSMIHAIPGSSAAGFNYIKKILNSDDWSQHSYGNAADLYPLGLLPRIWEWGLENARALKIGHLIYKDMIWSYNNPRVHEYTGAYHGGHVHVDMLPQWGGNPYEGGYPIVHKGGVVGPDGRIRPLRFETPALLESGETVLSKRMSKALASATNNSSATININVDIGQMYGDEESYRKLYLTLEQAAKRVAKERGVADISYRVT